MKKAKVFEEVYFKIKEPDWKLVRSIVLDCIGSDRNISDFERECGLGKGAVSKILLGRRTEPMGIEKMSKILSNADKRCHISLDGFAAANGLIPVSAAEKLLDSLKPGYKDVPDYRRAEYKDAEFVKYPVPDVNDFRRFAGNLTEFIENCQAEPELILRADELFEDKMLVLSLEKWHCHYRAEKGQENKTSSFSLSGKYCKVIMKALDSMRYLPAAG